MRRIALLLAAVLLVALAPGCGILGSSKHYRLVAWFPRAVSLYPSSQVRVLGLPAGSVDSIEIVGTQVKVTMAVNSDTPVPANVRAVITPQSLIGERYVQLTPAWRDGQPKAPDGYEIHDTIVPVEPDEALAALKNFIDSLDPNGLGRLITNAADDLDGQGTTFNHALDEISQLVSTFASKDDQLAGIVDNFDKFTATLSTREQQLGDILTTFSQATQVLADERQNIENLVGGLASLSQNGLQLVAKHGQQLRGDLDTLTRLAQSIDVNLGSLGQLLDSGPQLVNGLIGAYNPDLRAFNLRNNFGPLVQQLMNPVLQKVIPGFQGVPCVPIDGTCSNVSAQSATTPVSVSLAPATTPIDDLLALLRAPTVAPPPAPTFGDRVADGAGAAGGFVHDAAGAMVGAG